MVQVLRHAEQKVSAARQEQVKGIAKARMEAEAEIAKVKRETKAELGAKHKAVVAQLEQTLQAKNEELKKAIQLVGKEKLTDLKSILCTSCHVPVVDDEEEGVRGFFFFRTSVLGMYRIWHNGYRYLSTVLRSRAIFPWLRLQTFFCSIPAPAPGKKFRFALHLQKLGLQLQKKTDFDTKHLKNINFK